MIVRYLNLDAFVAKSKSGSTLGSKTKENAKAEWSYESSAQTFFPRGLYFGVQVQGMKTWNLC